MSALSFVRDVYVKMSDARFEREFVHLEKRIKKNKIIFTDLFHSLQRLKKRVDKPSEHALEKSGMINHLVYDLVKKLNTLVEEGPTQSYLIREAQLLAYGGASSLTQQMIALIGNFLTPADAARTELINPQFRNGLLLNARLQKDLFFERTQYLIKSFKSDELGLHDNYEIIPDDVFNKLYLIIDSIILKRILESHPTLIDQFDFIVINQTNEREHYFVQLEDEGKNIIYFQRIIREVNKKIDSLQNELSCIRGEIIDFIESDFNQNEFEETFKKQEHLKSEFYKESNEFVNNIKKIKDLNKKIHQMQLDRKTRDKFEMQMELSFLIEYLNPCTKLKHIAFYRNSPEFEKVYSRIRILKLREMLRKSERLEKEKQNKTKEKKEFDLLIQKLNRIAFAFANDDFQKGMKDFSSLKSEYQYRVCNYLKDHCFQEGYPGFIQEVWKNGTFGSDAFFGTNGMMASNTQRLRAVEELRDILLMEQELSEIKIATEEERNLVNGIIAFFGDDFNIGSQQYEKLSTHTKCIVNACMKLNKYEKSYVIQPGLKQSLDHLFESPGSTNIEKGHGLVRALWTLRAHASYLPSGLVNH